MTTPVNSMLFGLHTRQFWKQSFCPGRCRTIQRFALGVLANIPFLEQIPTHATEVILVVIFFG